MVPERFYLQLFSSAGRKLPANWIDFEDFFLLFFGKLKNEINFKKKILSDCVRAYVCWVIYILPYDGVSRRFHIFQVFCLVSTWARCEGEANEFSIPSSFSDRARACAARERRGNGDTFPYKLPSARCSVGDVATFVFVHSPRKMWALRRQSLAAIILGLTIVVTTSALEN